MGKLKINRVGVVSLGKLLGILYALFGFIAGIFITLISLIGVAFSSAFADAGTGMPLFGLLFGVGAIIFLPIFYGIMGFIGGVITAFFYNLAAKFAGGLELETE